VREKRQGASKTASAAAFLVAAGAVTTAAAQDTLHHDTRFDPGLPGAIDDLTASRPGPPRERGPVRIMGADAFFAAYGRRVAADTAFRQAEMREAINMRGVMPGYPQPPLVTFRMRLSL